MRGLGCRIARSSTWPMNWPIRTSGHCSSVVFHHSPAFADRTTPTPVHRGFKNCGLCNLLSRGDATSPTNPEAESASVLAAVLCDGLGLSPAVCWDGEMLRRDALRALHIPAGLGGGRLKQPLPPRQGCWPDAAKNRWVFAGSACKVLPLSFSFSVRTRERKIPTQGHFPCLDAGIASPFISHDLRSTTCLDCTYLSSFFEYRGPGVLIVLRFLPFSSLQTIFVFFCYPRTGEEH